jgi:hypothetical protein
MGLRVAAMNMALGAGILIGLRQFYDYLCRGKQELTHQKRLYVEALKKGGKSANGIDKNTIFQDDSERKNLSVSYYMRPHHL